MGNWQPPAHIRPVAIGVAIEEGRLLVVEVAERDGSILGYRPPGGGIEFGERAEDALHREFFEEMCARIEIIAPPQIIENFYTLNDARGHEIIFAFPIRVLTRSLIETPTFVIQEPDGSSDRAQWIDLDEFGEEKKRLLPAGLLVEHPR